MRRSVSSRFSAISRMVALGDPATKRRTRPWLVTRVHGGSGARASGASLLIRPNCALNLGKFQDSNLNKPSIDSPQARASIVPIVFVCEVPLEVCRGTARKTTEEAGSTTGTEGATLLTSH